MRAANLNRRFGPNLNLNLNPESWPWLNRNSMKVPQGQSGPGLQQGGPTNTQSKSFMMPGTALFRHAQPAIRAGRMCTKEFFLAIAKIMLLLRVQRRLPPDGQRLPQLSCGRAASAAVAAAAASGPGDFAGPPDLLQSVAGSGVSSHC